MDMKEELDYWVGEVNRPEFIETDPVQFVHCYEQIQNKEIAGILTATIAWGKRATILSDACKMFALLGNDPYDFIMGADYGHISAIESAVHRTFNYGDLVFFLEGLRGIYTRYESLEDVFAHGSDGKDLWRGIEKFRILMLEAPHEQRCEKHISDVTRGAAAKRLHLFLKWMVRDDGIVDAGCWKKIKPSALSIPLDVHVGNISRAMGLLTRKQNDRRAVEELDAVLRSLDALDPVRYDYALFGIGLKLSSVKK